VAEGPYHYQCQVEGQCCCMPSSCIPDASMANTLSPLARRHTNDHSRDASCHKLCAPSLHKRVEAETSSSQCPRHYHSTHSLDFQPFSSLPCMAVRTNDMSRLDMPVRGFSDAFASCRMTSPNDMATHRNGKSPCRTVYNGNASGAYASLPLQGKGLHRAAAPWNMMLESRMASSNQPGHQSECWGESRPHRQRGMMDT
jgi:hypothetical protein